MKKILVLLPVVLVALFAFTPGKDKKEAFEGRIQYSMVYEEIPEEYEASAAFLPKEMTMYIKGKKSRMEQNMAMGSVGVIVDSEKKEMTMLMNIMGTKTAYKMTADEFNKENAVDTSKATVKYVDGAKEIAGFKCKKAEVTKSGETTEVWYTEEIPAGLSRGFSYLNGFPMEYTTNNNGMIIKMTVTAIVKEKVSADWFKIPDGFEVKPYSDFKKAYGG